jgi:hypothetical protein
MRLILGHHDDWLPGFSIPTNTGPSRSVVAAVAPRVELVEMGYYAAYPLFAGLAEDRLSGTGGRQRALLPALDPAR